MAKKTRKPRTQSQPRTQPHPRAVNEADGEIGRRIRLRRVELGISQSELGDKLGVSFQQVQKYEKGANRVAADRLNQICKALDIPVTAFFDGQSKDREAETLMFQDAKFNLRLLKAYAAIGDVVVQRQFISLMEKVAGISATAEEE